jgi:hypothetical protein
MKAPASSKSLESLQALYEAHEGKVSDKWAAYIALYDTAFRRFRDQPVRLLEIGIQNGGSLEIWSRFFPNAQKIVGCDINERCRLLAYDDPRIEVVVGDANDPEIFQRITSIAPEYDIIIDDGSHVSSDIVRSFGLYFPVVATGGLYVAEDLHCSYWDSFEGGIEAPYSSLAFFRRLTDQTNREHWGAPLPASATLSFFAQNWNAQFDDASLGLIEEVAFRNSTVIVSKGKPGDSLLGARVVRGKSAVVDPAPQQVSGQAAVAPDQRHNAYGPLAERSETLLMTLPGKVKALEDALAEKNAELAHLAAHADTVEARLAMTEAELVKTRQHPHKALGDTISFHVLRGLSTAPLPVSSKMRTRFAKSAAKRDPKRKA